ncbi:MAG TPA: exodeoxyribonuclease VII small subunit [Salinivirgaceae bacterium]|nr:exodeoxyribonuclease VII small subunit [Salinivirgaceae bacterium]
MAKKNLTYKEKIEEIEEIIDFVEKHPLEIDLLQTKIQRAVELIAECKKELTDSEKKIQQMLDDSDEYKGINPNGMKIKPPG